MSPQAEAVVPPSGSETAIPGLPGFRLAELLNSSGEIRAVAVYEGTQQIQTLNLCTDKPVAKTGELGAIAFADFNFDGRPDLALLVSSTADNNSYCVWLFDPRTRRFVFSEGLSRLINPAPDPNTRTIITYRNEDCAGGCFRRDTYAWSGSSLIPLRHETQNEDPTVAVTDDCRFVRTIRKQKNGKMVEVSRDRVNGAGVRCEPHPF